MLSPPILKKDSFKILIMMLTKKRFHTLIYQTIVFIMLAGIVTSCSTPTNLPDAQNAPKKQNIEERQVAESTNTTTSCPTIESRNWKAWVDRVAENEPKLNISGEVDLPTPGYKAEWRSGILDRRQPPTQRLSISFTPPEGTVIQVITPTEVSFTMPSPVLEYSSVTIYCGDKLLADIPGVVPTD